MKDKEKQIVDKSWRAKMVAKGIYKDSEEISKADKDLMQLCKLLFENWDGTVLTVAKTVLGHYQPKLHEDSVVNTPTIQCETYSQNDIVVLTREEYEKLQKRNADRKRLRNKTAKCKDELNRAKEANKNLLDLFKIEIDKSSKETAEKFANFVKSKLFELGNIVNERDVDDMLKEYLCTM